LTSFSRDLFDGDIHKRFALTRLAGFEMHLLLRCVLISRIR